MKSSESVGASLSTMRFPAKANLTRTVPALLTAASIAFAAGCASPGPPLPPSLHLPRTVGDLAAVRVGDTVELHWTTPSRTTDELDIKGPITAEICRHEAGNASSMRCLPRISVKPGPSHETDSLPVALTRDSLQLLAYHVQIFNANGRSAGSSHAAFSVAGPAPSPVEQLHATAARSGVALDWTATAELLPVDLDRTLISGPPLPATKDLSSKPASKATRKPVSALHAVKTEPVEVHLEAPSQSADTGRTSGTIDRSVQRGATYRYTARRIRMVNLAGHTLEMRGVPSPMVTVVVNDTFAPAVPTGLAAIPGTGSIDLSWEPVADTDVSGYIVYRQQADASGNPVGKSVRLNAAPVIGPAYSDRTAVAAQSYLYRVTAIDVSGNESTPSAAVEETVPEP